MPDREAALDVALAQIEKQFGKGTAMRLGSREVVAMPAISTGSLGLDLALGVLGYPRGRVIEIYGPESSGKTSLALHAAASVQKAGGSVAFIDAEHALDPAWADRLGCVSDDFTISQPDCGEQALEVADILVRSGAVDLVVVDSVAALTPRAEIEGEMGDSSLGMHARLMSQALRKLTAAANQSKTTIIFINQLREKIGVMFGSPETTTGGKALKFYATIRLDVRRIETLKEDGSAYGNRVKVKVVKNKVSPPFKVVEFDFLFSQGISSEGELVDMGVIYGIVRKAGAWYTYDGDQLGQGKGKAAAHLREHPELAAAIRAKILEKARPETPADTPAQPGTPADTPGQPETSGNGRARSRPVGVPG
jgi:recombination protein RecA